jgi:uncharacterized protein
LIKYLVLIAVIAVILWMVTGKARAAARRERAQAERDAAERPIEDMVRCAHCGVFLPRAESVEARGARFCSREHERLH